MIKASHDAVITGKEYGCWETKGKVYLLCKKRPRDSNSVKQVSFWDDGINGQDTKLRNVTAVVYLTTPGL